MSDESFATNRPSTSDGNGGFSPINSSSGVVYVFAKPPVAGAVKTRLGQSVGNPVAAEFAKAFFQDTWARLSREHSGPLVLATPLHGSDAIDATSVHNAAIEVSSLGFPLSGNVSVWDQGWGDLGQRMARALVQGLQLAEFATIIGSDVPHFPENVLARAEHALLTHDVVLGPSEDGGFYLIGARRFAPGILDRLPWSQSHTLLATQQRLDTLRFTTATVDRCFDIDDLSDLLSLKSRLEHTPSLAPNTYAALLRLRASLP